MESTRENLLIKMVLDAWFSKVEKADLLFNALSDVDLQKEVAPGRSRGIYLLGHLTAVNDRLMPLLGLGSSLHPELYEMFVQKADRAVSEIPSSQSLKGAWKEINEVLRAKFESLPAEEWFGRHASVSEEDFMKEPHRNKLNVIINRTNHLDYHLGQVVFLKSK
jgi:hypothetical protein